MLGAYLIFNKVGCVFPSFPIVVVPIQKLDSEFGRNNHREDATDFITYRGCYIKLINLNGHDADGHETSRS